MCIGVLGQIRAIDGNQAKVDVCGIQCDVDLTLVGIYMKTVNRIWVSECWFMSDSP